MTPTKKLAVIAMLVAQASVLHFVESLLPNPIPIPGVKLGLANIITLLALVIFDFKSAMQITVLRTVLGSLLTEHCSG
jgi:heptaprenyl diphosphate synthase